MEKNISIEVNDASITDPQEVSEKFNSFFIDAPNKIINKINVRNYININLHHTNISNSIFLTCF